MKGVDENLPSNDSKCCLQSPGIDVPDSSYIPKEVWSEEVIPEKLPDDRRCPKVHHE